MTTNVLALNAVGLLLSSLMIDLVFAVDLSKPETRSTSPAEKSIFVAPDASCAVWTAAVIARRMDAQTSASHVSLVRCAVCRDPANEVIE